MGRTVGRTRRPRGQRVLRLRRELLTADDAEVLQARVAGSLLAQGRSAGDRVAFFCSNSSELLCALLGAMRVGIAPVPLNPALLAEERALILEDAEPTLVVGDAEL